MFNFFLTHKLQRPLYDGKCLRLLNGGDSDNDMCLYLARVVLKKVDDADLSKSSRCSVVAKRLPSSPPPPPPPSQKSLPFRETSSYPQLLQVDRNVRLLHDFCRLLSSVAPESAMAASAINRDEWWWSLPPRCPSNAAAVDDDSPPSTAHVSTTVTISIYVCVCGVLKNDNRNGRTMTLSEERMGGVRYSEKSPPPRPSRERKQKSNDDTRNISQCRTSDNNIACVKL